MRIEALDDPPFHLCQYVKDGGCSIYEDRPSECRTWFCAWARDDQFLSDRDRPDKGGVMYYWIPELRLPNGTVVKDVPMLKCQEVTPGAFDAERNQSLFERLTKKGYILIKNRYMAEDGAAEVEICVPTHEKHKLLRDHVEKLIRGSATTKPTTVTFD